MRVRPVNEIEGNNGETCVIQIISGGQLLVNKPTIISMTTYWLIILGFFKRW